MQHIRLLRSSYISLLALAAALTTFQTSAASQDGGLDWKNSSVLATGKWIRIETEAQGIAKIPYSKLLEMGFESPEKVGVFGRGGAMMPLSLTDAEGNHLVADDIPQVACMHHDGALYFYALGTDAYHFKSDSNSPYFAHQSKNIYSRNAVYFLSDAYEPLPVRPRREFQVTASKEAECFGLAFHELDLEHNTFNNGQLFWGESLKDPSQPYREKTSLPGLKPGGTATMECGAYVEGADKNAILGTLTFGLSGENGGYSSRVGYNNTSNFQQVPGTRANITVSSDTPEVFVGYDGYDDNHLCANLDYWSITYPLDPSKAISNENQQISFAAVHPLIGKPSIAMPATPAMAWDVTDPYSPVLLRGMGSGGSCLLSESDSGCSMIAIFNPDGLDNAVSTWSEIPNQDIHALAAEGADFAIITLPMFLEQATRLARLHEEHYGQKCIVATTRQLYNEYSGGTPDIMAYRRFARMLYDSPKPVENILLFGSIRADARAIKDTGESSEYIMAFQTPSITKRDGAMNDNDFIGIMSGRIGESQRLETLPMEVGVGVLPLVSVDEARMYVDKAERYMAGDGLSSVMASHLMVGCDGDSHQHEEQCLKLQAEFEGYHQGHIFTTLFNDHIGNEATNRGITAALNSGVGLASYIGHGGNFMLTKEAGVFHFSDIRRLRNAHTPFMYFSACNITTSDMARRGISEEMVLGTRHGLIGSITSSRTAWSGPNFELMKAFYSSLYQSRSLDPDPLPITIGKAYAEAKTSMTSSNELSFMLLCDPALKIPVVLREMSDPRISARAGEKITLSGYVVNSNGDVDHDFNGTISARVLAPAVIEPVAGVVSGTPGVSDVTYRSETLSLGGGTVTDGLYTASILLPTHVAADGDQDYSIHLTAYDPQRHMSAASRHDCEINVGDSPDIKDDFIAPWVTSVEYDHMTGCLEVETADDTALDLSLSFPSDGFALRIDGDDVAASQCGNITVLSDVSECRRTIPVGNLSKGRHAAFIRVRDAAGNVHEEERSFETGDVTPSILSADCRNTEGRVMFGIEGDSCSGDVIIYDMSGKRLLSVKATAGNAETGTELLAAGRYRAVFVSGDGKTRSNAVTLTII